MNEWKPTLRLSLTPQEAPRVQASLFILEPAATRCAHPETENQQRLDGGMDRVCVQCGSTIAKGGLL